MLFFIKDIQSLTYNLRFQRGRHNSLRLVSRARAKLKLKGRRVFLSSPPRRLNLPRTHTSMQTITALTFTRFGRVNRVGPWRPQPPAFSKYPPQSAALPRSSPRAEDRKIDRKPNRDRPGGKRTEPTTERDRLTAFVRRSDRPSVRFVRFAGRVFRRFSRVYF